MGDANLSSFTNLSSHYFTGIAEVDYIKINTPGKITSC
jgi:hypothetical protein